MNRLRDRLAENARGEIGQASAVAREVLDCPGQLDALVALLADDDATVVAHAAHAAMQVALDRPDLFQGRAAHLISLLARPGPWERGEQLPKILARLDLEKGEASRLAKILLGKLDERSTIAAASALSALVELACTGRIEPAVARRAHSRALASPRKALAARARRLAQKVRDLG
ncbi:MULTISPECIES: hypothetical protein [Nitratireductor]|uniref:hypothetical protein n=1 Tax=Nitratireductor TaxID=245876 RepID=UPI000D0E0A7F|nr:MULTISPECIES: hypothetical protein [Nitratireductor]PSM19801.1 hypothetical protein C7T96_01620 [Nitratireductor sp. StC3]